MKHVATALNRRRILLMAIVAVFGLGLYFRLWNIEHLFSIVHDYDEGAYSLAARFISEGYVPYRDFLFVHPPVHIYVLAALQKVFGYSFFVGRYLSIAASMTSAVVLFVAGRRLYGTTRAGLVAGAFMLLETQMMYLGRRTVQESLGLLFVCGGLLFAADFLASGRRSRLIPAGMLLGVAIAVKYIMAPVVFGIVLGLAVVSLPEEWWRKVRLAARPLLLVLWGCFSFAAYTVLVLLKWLGLSALPVPFTDAIPPGAASWIVVLWVIVFPLIAALFFVIPRGRRIDGGVIRTLVTSRVMWIAAFSVVAGFFLVTAYFWVAMPGEFLRQTVFLQSARPTTEFPSIIAFVRAFGIGAYLGFLRLSMLPVLLVVPAIVLLMNRRVFSRTDCFVAVALAGGLVLCQWLYHLPRYYVSLFPLLFLGIAWMAPSLRSGTLSSNSKAGLVFIAVALVASVNLDIMLLRNYTAIDVLWADFTTEEEDIYRATEEYLESVGARKIYATSPAYAAMADKLDSTLAFDTFALLWLEERPAEVIVDDLRRADVEYVLLDRWSRDWGLPYSVALDELTTAIRLNAQLVHTVYAESANRVEVYRLLDEPADIANGDFRFWTAERGQACPIGWRPLLSAGDADHASLGSIESGEDRFLGITLYENGRDATSGPPTYAGITQQMPFPAEGLVLTAMPGRDTEMSGGVVLGPAVHVQDEAGHSVVYAFSSRIDSEIVTVAAPDKVEVQLAATTGQWSTYLLDVPSHWERAGWPEPQQVTVVIVLFADADHPGHYSFHVSGLEKGRP